MADADSGKTETIFVRASGELKDSARIKAAKAGYSSVAEYVRDLIRSDGVGTESDINEDMLTEDTTGGADDE